MKGKVIFKGGIKGQKVRVALKKKKDYIEGRLLEVLGKIPLKKKKPDLKYDDCGGCTYQTLFIPR